MEKKRLILPLILTIVFCLAFMLSSENVEAHTLTINTPGTGALVNGTFNFTATVAYASFDGDNVSNVTWYYRTGTTGDWTIAGSSVNTTGEVIFSNLTYVSAWADGTTYQINATAYEEEAGATFNCSDVNTGVYVDNTAPTANLVVSRVSLEINDAMGVTLDCSGSSDAVDSALTIIYYITEPDGTTTSATKTNVTGSDMKYAFDDDRSIYDIYGSYTVTCRVFDDVSGHAGIEATNNSDVWIGSKDRTIEVIIAEDELKKEERQPGVAMNYLYTIIFVVLLSLVCLYLLLKTKKKK